MNAGNANQSGEWGWGPWIRFYVLLLFIFFEVVVLVFQNVEKKRLGYELSVLVEQKKQLMDKREELWTRNLRTEHLDEVAEMVESTSMELKPYRWSVVWLKNHG